MKAELQLASLLCGGFLFLFAFANTFGDAIGAILFFSHLLPGSLFGSVLALYAAPAKLLNRIGLVVASTLIYLLAVYVTDSASSSSADAPLLFLFGSGVGALLLKLCYDVLISKYFSIRTTLINPIAIGFIAALPGAISLYYCRDISYEQQLTEVLAWAGILIIFPLWQYLFSWNVNKTSEAAAKAVCNHSGNFS